jgi:hypothetical protein
MSDKEKQFREMNIVTYFMHMVSDSTIASSRRFITLISFLVLMLISLVDLFTEFTPTQFVYDGLFYVVVAGFGAGTVEKFSKKTVEPPVENKQ